MPAAVTPKLSDDEESAELVESLAAAKSRSAVPDRSDLQPSGSSPSSRAASASRSGSKAGRLRDPQWEELLGGIRLE